jgi:shikimate dehydrogenase
VKMVGLIGYPVEHSLSPAMHNAAFAALGLAYHYVLLPTPSDQLKHRVRDCIEQGFAGWNITVPHKQAMLPYLDTRSEEVAATGACNTVLLENGKLQGFNTDIAAFMDGLKEAGGIVPNSIVVVLGAGGAARAVTYALSRAGHRVNILSRRPKQAAELVEALSTHTENVTSKPLDEDTLRACLTHASLLVNCTPAGMWPETDASPLPEGISIPSGVLVYDLVYRPRPTLLLQFAKAAGCRTQDGLSMLVHQGAAAFKIWTGAEPPVDVMREACEA